MRNIALQVFPLNLILYVSLLLLSGNLIGMSEDSVLTGDIVVSAPGK